jgi:hypothetical protein
MSDGNNNCFLRKDDKLFKNADIKCDGPWGSAMIAPHKRLNCSTPPAWDLYSIGYKMAADVLIENSGRYPDFLIYPIVFLYRQYIELRLKQIIIQGNSIIDNSKVIPDYVYNKSTRIFDRWLLSIPFPNGFLHTDFLELSNTAKRNEKTIYQMHKLDLLWNEAKETVMQLFPDDLPEELDAPESCIKQFYKIDKDSYKYRYPVDTKGRSVHSSYVLCKAISLKNLKDVMNKLSFFLDGTCECILDMPAHGYLLPNQTKMNEEQCKELWDLLKSLKKELKLEEIQKIMEIKFKLRYSTEQIHKILCEYSCKMGEDLNYSACEEACVEILSNGEIRLL